MAGTFSPWVNQTNFGEAFANLRHGNQFATLTNMALAALVWVNFYIQPTSGLARPNRYAWVMAAAGFLAVGNTVSSSRTGLLQLALLCGF